jgi:hypothetical protein
MNIGMRIASWIRNALKPAKETFTVGGYSYPVADFIGYSQEKQIDILTRAGATPEDIHKFLVFIKEWGE